MASSFSFLKLKQRLIHQMMHREMYMLFGEKHPSNLSLEKKLSTLRIPAQLIHSLGHL